MGRSRQFDVDEALDAALGVFWRKGYEGASYTDLTQAAGVERPALYAAFGNKEALFLRALERYYEHELAFFAEALKKPTSREVVSDILRGTAEFTTRSSECPGCLGVHGALAGSDDAEPVRRAAFAVRASGEASLRERLERSKLDGDLPEGVDCTVLAAYICTVAHGMAVQAKAGAGRALLEAVAEQALATWPARPTRRARKSSSR